MEIIEYAPKFKDDFIKFNTDRSIDNFGFLVNEDTETFSHIEEALTNGAMIYFAVKDGTALA
ncbi:MAG: hypothetical protein OSJ43_09620 [Oscillospiraceae bacterium]|nr:hypothetical protein [Oscillospiraceae bacterium]